jgi:hypothetical protein
LRDSAEAGDVSDLQIGGVSQEVSTHTDTMAVFNIIDVPDVTTAEEHNLYFPVGIPAGHDLIRAGFTLEPRLVMVSPNAGTTGSTLITALVPGVGKETTGLKLVNGATSSTICMDDPVVVEYGKIQCWTKRDNFGTEALDIKLVHGETTFECANSDTTKCQYTQNNDKNEEGNT